MEPPPLPTTYAEFSQSKTRYHSFDESSDDVVEITAMDCERFSSKRQNKRAKVVPQDVIDIDEDEDLIVNEKVITGKGKGTLKGYDKSWANPVKEALDFMDPANATEVGVVTGFPQNALKSFPLAANTSNTSNFGNFQNALDNSSSYYDNLLYNDCALSLQSQFFLPDFSPSVEASISWFDQPSSIYNNLIGASSSSFSNQLNSSSYVCKDDTEIWMPKLTETRTTLAVTNRPSNPCQSSSGRVEETQEDEVQKKLRLFKRFETVHDYSDHHFASCMGSKSNQAPRNVWVKKIQQEWKILEKDLPDTIFVRVYEERMDILRAVIMGAAGTPYHDGLFFFDFFFPPDYPNKPPQVHYHSGGLRLNPNLYNCGKVCLSLLNTWQGNKDEKWTPRKSTVLQVLLSIQALVLNAQPYFNEPGYASLAGSKDGETRSQEYNENVYILSCKTMLYTLRRPPKHFEDFVLGHFREKAHAILVACKAYMEGAQVGCLVGGGVQDLEEGDKCGSQNFKTQVTQMVESLVPAFIQNGAKDCEKFLPRTNYNRYGGDSNPPAFKSNAFPSNLFPSVANPPIFTSVNQPIFAPTGFGFY